MLDLHAKVAGMYAAFQRGDIPAIIAELAPDVRWDHWIDNAGQQAGVPWLQPRTGPNEVVDFFRLMSTYQFKEFTVNAIMVGVDRVVGQVTCEFTIPSGITFRDEEMHLFIFNAVGQVQAFRHYNDTAKALRTLGL